MADRSSHDGDRRGHRAPRHGHGRHRQSRSDCAHTWDDQPSRTGFNRTEIRYGAWIIAAAITTAGALGHDAIAALGPAHQDPVGGSSVTSGAPGTSGSQDGGDPGDGASPGTHRRDRAPRDHDDPGRRSPESEHPSPPTRPNAGPREPGEHHDAPRDTGGTHRRTPERRLGTSSTGSDGSGRERTEDGTPLKLPTPQDITDGLGTAVGRILGWEVASPDQDAGTDADTDADCS